MCHVCYDVFFCTPMLSCFLCSVQFVRCCSRVCVCVYVSACAAEIYTLVSVFASITDMHTFVSPRLCFGVCVRATKAAWSQQPG